MYVRDIEDRHDAIAVATCDDFARFAEALSAMERSGADAVVVRNEGSDMPAELARFAEALIAGAREAGRSATIGWTVG